MEEKIICKHSTLLHPYPLSLYLIYDTNYLFLYCLSLTKIYNCFKENSIPDLQVVNSPISQYYGTLYLSKYLPLSGNYIWLYVFVLLFIILSLQLVERLSEFFKDMSSGDELPQVLFIWESLNFSSVFKDSLGRCNIHGDTFFFQ